MGNIQSSLKANPERAALVSLDTMMVSIMTTLGTVGKLGTCTAVEIAAQDLADLLNLIEYSSEGKYKLRLSYYNVATRLVDLVGLCWFKQNLAEKIC